MARIPTRPIGALHVMVCYGVDPKVRTRLVGPIDVLVGHVGVEEVT